MCVIMTMEVDEVESKSNIFKIFSIGMIVILLALSGYLVYDKLTVQKDNEEKIAKYESDIKKLQNDLKGGTDNTTNNCTAETTTINQIDLLLGNWHYEETFDSGGLDCTATIKLELKEDGTYTYENGSTCSGGTSATGKYSISKNKIYLQNNNCQSIVSEQQCIYPNCKPIIELDYENNQISATRVGGNKVNLTHN